MLRYNNSRFNNNGKMYNRKQNITWVNPLQKCDYKGKAFLDFLEKYFPANAEHDIQQKHLKVS